MGRLVQSMAERLIWWANGSEWETSCKGKNAAQSIFGIWEVLMKVSVLFAAAGLVMASPAVAESWNIVSRGPNNAFMVDVDAITVSGEITSMPVAAVPRLGASTDYSHSVEIYEFRCADGHWRTAGIVEYDENETEINRISEEGGNWEPSRLNTLPGFLKQIACDGVRAVPPTWPSIKVFIDSGRVLPSF